MPYLFLKFLPFFKFANKETTISGDFFNKKNVGENEKEPAGIHKVRFQNTNQINCSIHNQVYYMTKEEFFEPIKDEYIQNLSQLKPEEIYDNYNPGCIINNRIENVI